MKENFEKNNNPFCPFGTIGRLAYFITNTLILIISSALLYFFTPTGVRLSNEQLLVKDYSQLSIMLNNAPKKEIAIFILIVLAIMFFKFIIAKKRIMDIAPNNPNIIRNSYLIASGIALLPFMANFVVPVVCWENTLLFFTSVVITLYMFFKKGDKPSENILKTIENKEKTSE